MNFASILVVMICAAACSSSVPPNARSAHDAPRERESNGQFAKTVELRHFYRLSPGPNATLIVTERDLQQPSSTETVALESGSATPH